jgi:AraC-like DNA-binding protein
MHEHAWNQFVYATSGTLVVVTEDCRYVITPEQAIWLPAGVTHTSGALSGAEFRNLYIADSSNLRMPSRCMVLVVSAFMRALIVELVDVQTRQENEAYMASLDSMIIEQLHRLEQQAFHLPWPRSVALRALCEAVYSAPDDARTLDEWSRYMGMSSRTLARRFQNEVGLGFREWKLRLRLFRAVEWLGAGRSVTQVALDLGYASTSAFTYMFHQEMGCTPSEWFRQ